MELEKKISGSEDVVQFAAELITRVGRCIKHAIDVSFSYAGITAIEKIFGSAYSPVKGRPTNAEYLGALAEQIRYAKE